MTLPAGTRYFVESSDGTLSEERVLDEDTEVEAKYVGPLFSLYVNESGQTLVVYPEVK